MLAEKFRKLLIEEEESKACGGFIDKKLFAFIAIFKL
jgi:hypothetical protein